ncbi:acyltransferase [Nocardia sp. XZ_19_385]|uniref:phthiocerol/phthiodiolone dimycocerosyl transferase family protein n=1 Tax=Nocardia sp. XZ_19_385 TaxID=2769488 RepID=UPI002816163E|nr:acyltransferase [Nocardia sp. XZ_19_385]
MRVLAPSEQRFVRHGTYTGRTVRVEGELDVAALRTAFLTLQRAYPVLTCRIGEDSEGVGYLLRSGGATVGAWVRDGAVDQVRLPVQPVDPGVQLAYLDVVIGGSAARVTLFAHHSVADAGHCVELVSRLWSFYTDRLTPEDVVPHELPKPVEEYAADRGITGSAVSGFEDVTRPLPPDARTPADPATPAPPSLAQPRRAVLDPVATARIVELGHRPGLTVNGLVTAALLRAYVAETGSTTTASVGCLYPVDLRTRFDPPVARAAGTNMAGLASFAAEVDLTADISLLAHQISSRLHHDLSEGIVQQSVLHFPDFYGPTRIHSLAGHVAVTNTGRVPAFRTPPELTLADYEIVYLSAHPRPSTGASAAVTFLLYTFQGRLTIGVLGGGVAAERLPAAVRRELAGLYAESV